MGPVPQVSSSLTLKDHLGTFKVRWGIGRMSYTVEPGLYAVGRPDGGSPVMVTANYKMSFDRLRQALHGRNAWILVLETKGINVWCAAGKGTFGTEELVSRIASSGLSGLVSHRELILPQLAGPGVAAHEVKKRSGFKVIYGPIRAEDLPAFLDSGFKATPEMRIKTFSIRERIVLIPIELVAAMKGGALLLILLSIISFLVRGAEGWFEALDQVYSSAQAILVAILSGAVLTPVLLPWLPGRAFSVKGALMGGVTAFPFLWLRWGHTAAWSGSMEKVAWLLIIPALSAFLAMNFTGASTFTSLSGVKKEMRWAVPFQVAAGLIGFSLWLGSQWI
ncbi:MAG: mercury methylation corrinoid protein HgcA [Desulfobacterota bacterium]|nr:mercury methylation corrinoid protein HgcA [Thermodesulfobacteriota bacterium]